MAQAADLPTTSRFHNLSSGALADALGHADAVLKGVEAECKALKDEIKRRGLLEATGDSFAIRVSEEISGRLDVAAVKQHLGDAWRRFELATVSPVVRIGCEAARCGSLSPTDWLPRLAAPRASLTFTCRP
jgi:hypothetical protein